MSEYLSTNLNSILGMIDLLIAKKQTEDVEANLYSARLHIHRAIKESAITTVAA